MATGDPKGEGRDPALDATLDGGHAALDATLDGGHAALDATLDAVPPAGGGKASPVDATLDAGAPPPGQLRQSEFPRNWPRYQYLDFLGEGGMGKVWKAFDPTLRRKVAIKLVRGDDPDTRARLVREAAAQAHLSHPHVCRVYEVGEVEGRPFIAMQLIEGPTLQQAAYTLNLQEKLRLLSQVADALAAAHALGIVHRDLKPANIMLERGADGAFVPYVMDFGLARDPRDGQLTQDNAVMGTPAYMPPEQARGEVRAIDARSDVYALGATLYAVLAGRPPFDAPSSMEILVQVIQTEPKPLRQVLPGAPADVETIIMKCLEKEQGRRYPSARALADDLRRYLAGEPIQARPASRAYRARLWLKRHRAVASVAALGLATALGLVGWLAKTRHDAQVQSEVAARFSERVKEIEQRMRVAALLPTHDVSSDRGWVRARLAGLRDEMQAVGSLAEGPGSYALGRAALALGEVDVARSQLERAWAAGYRHPEVALALGSAWEQTWERDRDEAAREHARAGAADDERAARAAASEWLKQARGTPLIAAELLEALIDYAEGRVEASVDKARAAYRDEPQLFEARVLEGRAWSKLGHKKAQAGDFAEARRLYAESVRALDAAIDVARSDPFGHFQRCRVWDRILQVPPERAGGLRADAAVTACRLALSVDPASDNMHGKLAIALAAAAEERGAGPETRPLLDEASREAARAIELAPRAANHYRALASARRLLGDFDGARAAVARGLATGPDPKRVQRLNLTLAQVELAAAQAALDRNTEPAAPLAAARTALDQARATIEDYAVLAATARLATLDALATGWRRQDTRSLQSAARAAIARAIAVSRETTPDLAALGAALDRLR